MKLINSGSFYFSLELFYVRDPLQKKMRRLEIKRTLKKSGTIFAYTFRYAFQNKKIFQNH